VDRFYTIEEGNGLVPSVYDGIAAERARSKSSASHLGK
jgi:hypothetical protein